MSNDLGIDRSGNGNSWTVNNMAFADQVLDSPTNNFCTLNPLQHDDAAAYSEGNLKITTPNYPFATGTFWVDSGKWYWEWVDAASTLYRCYNGICNKDRTPGGENHQVADNQSWVGHSDGTTKNWTASGTDGSISNIAAGDILAAALDLDNGSIKWYKNGSLIHTDSTLPAGELVTPMCMATNDGYSGAQWSDDIFNFGQDSSFAGEKTAQGNQDGNSIGDFYYTPPSGYLALCTSNLPDVAVTPSEHFNIVTYSGTGNGVAVTGVGFQPDLVWGKKYSSPAQNHWLIDAVRGAGVWLASDGAGAEGTEPAGSSFTSDGFTTNNNSLLTYSGGSYVLWNWKAGGSGSANNDGDNNATVSANTDAKFSIVSYTGSGDEPKTVAHGLGVSPEMVIIKKRNNTGSWVVWHKDLADNYAFEGLDTTGAAVSGGSPISKYVDAVSSTLVTLGDASENNNSGDTFIMYCWASIDGYSKVGSYTGNDDADGVFVYTGFRPAYVMIKSTGSSTAWLIQDGKRTPYNVCDNHLRANGNDAQQSGATLDLVSNGFKIREDGIGTNDGSYIYLAFAETPFKYANAR